MARNRTANISGELITNTLFVTSTSANVSNAVLKTGDTMTGLLNVANNLVVTGNVGIGTASPNARLHVSGGSTILNNASGSAAIAQSLVVAGNANADNSGPFISFQTEALAETIRLGGIRRSESWGIDIMNTSSTSLLFVRSDGNVGIGTTSPLARLDVVNSADTNRSRIRNSGGSEAVLLFQNSDTGTTTQDGLFVGIGADETAYLWNYENKDLVFGTNGTERARIKSDGKVGIGTTSIENLLQVAGAMGLNFSAMTSNATTGDFTITLGGLSTLAGNAWQSAGLLVFYSGVDGDQTNGNVLVTALFLRGLGTWGNASTINIVGTATVTTANETSTGLDITFDVSNNNFGSVFAVVLGGSFNGGARPTISITP